MPAEVPRCNGYSKHAPSASTSKLEGEIEMKRHLITTALIALTVTMALAVESPQQPPSVITDPEFRGILENLHPQEVKSLAGIKEMSVVIDRLNADLVASGLRGEEIRNDAEALLRGVQISAVSQQQLKKVDGYPFLK